MRRRLSARRTAMAVLWVVGVLWMLFILSAVVASVVLEADGMVDVGGPWMLLLYLVVPTCIALPWLIGRLREYREDRYYTRKGEELLREPPSEEGSSGWRTLREGDESAKEGMAALSAAQRRARGEQPGQS